MSSIRSCGTAGVCESINCSSRAPAHADLVVVGDRIGGSTDVELIGRLKEDPLTFQIPVLQHSAAAAGDDARVEGLASGADVVFFGESVPRERVEAATTAARPHGSCSRCPMTPSSGPLGP